LRRGRRRCRQRFRGVPGHLSWVLRRSSTTASAQYSAPGSWPRHEEVAVLAGYEETHGVPPACRSNPILA
jgi:hypothetical protein